MLATGSVCPCAYNTHRVCASCLADDQQSLYSPCTESLIDPDERNQVRWRRPRRPGSNRRPTVEGLIFFDFYVVAFLFKTFYILSFNQCACLAISVSVSGILVTVNWADIVDLHFSSYSLECSASVTSHNTLYRLRRNVLIS